MFGSAVEANQRPRPGGPPVAPVAAVAPVAPVAAVLQGGQPRRTKVIIKQKKTCRGTRQDLN